MSIRFFDMFSGIGGFRSGLEAVGGFECVGHCEIDKHANQAYNAIYQPKGEVYFEDATKIDPHALPDIDLICGGFPCQAFSIAGKRGGFDDARGTLFFEIARIAAVKRPSYLFLENVPGLLSHDGGRTFTTILSALSKLGYLIDSAKQNNTVAKYLLGKLFLKGEHIPKNVDYALRWLEEAVEDGNPYAEYILGKTLLKGEDVEQDIERAENLLRRSIAQGNRYAAYTLGKALLDGDILPQDIPEAMRLLKMSADRNFPQAQYIFGKLLYRGELTEQDISKALEYLENASSQKNPYAAYLAGKIRLTEEAHKDIAKAIRYFEIAAEGGNDYAEYQLGKLYLYGKDIPQDYDKAMEYLNASAEHGNRYAEQLLHNIKNNRNWAAGMGVFRLFRHMGRILENNIRDDKTGGGIDKKLRRQINEKKQAQGLKLG